MTCSGTTTTAFFHLRIEIRVVQSLCGVSVNCFQLFSACLRIRHRTDKFTICKHYTSVVRMHVQSHYVRLPLKRFNTPHVTITRRIPPALSCAEREHGSRNHQVTSAAQIHFHGMHWHREAVLNNIECSTYLAMRWALIFPKARLSPIRILHVHKNPPK